MYTCGGFIFDIWQNKYNYVKFKNKIKLKKKSMGEIQLEGRRVAGKGDPTTSQ